MSLVASLKPSFTIKRFDNLFVIGSPLLAFLAVALVCEPRFKSGEFLFNPETPGWFIGMAALLTHSHVLLVFLRSHLNSDVFSRHPWRFKVIPLFMLIAMWGSPVVLGVAAFIGIYWDEYHSLMQTFGFGRMYDAKLGNDPHVGRKLDMIMSFVLGLLPHMILLTFIPESERAQGFLDNLDIGPDITQKYGAYVTALRYPFIAFGVGFSLYYLFQYQKLIKNGYQFSKDKLNLFASTGIASVLMASMYSVADAAYFGNIYHALQYYFIVYISEGALVSKKLGVPKEKKKTTLGIYCFGILSAALLLAYARAQTEMKLGFFQAFWLLTSLLHFWYDGFIWSVRKKEI